MLIAEDGAANDFFGFSTALYGDTLLVSALKDDDGGEDTGSVYVFKKQIDGWAFRAKLLAEDGEPGGAGSAYVYDLDDQARQKTID